MRPYFYKLVNSHHTAYDNPVINFYMPAHVNGICQYHIITYNGIMGNMNIIHEETVIAYYGLAACACSAAKGRKLPNNSILPDFKCCVFTCKLKVLRLCR